MPVNNTEGKQNVQDGKEEKSHEEKQININGLI